MCAKFFDRFYHHSNPLEYDNSCNTIVTCHTPRTSRIIIIVNHKKVSSYQTKYKFNLLTITISSFLQNVITTSLKWISKICYVRDMDDPKIFFYILFTDKFHLWRTPKNLVQNPNLQKFQKLLPHTI